VITYRYDGSFEGFLCAVADCLEQGHGHPDFVRDDGEAGCGLFSCENREIPIVRDVALTLRGKFVTSVSQEAFATARYAFQSRKEGIEMLVWRYLLLGLEEGKRLEGMLTLEPVWSVNRIARKVSHEAHKFKGFVRFREVAEGFLYASIEPEADVLPLIAPHFVERVGDRPWMIHDLRRRQAALYDLRSWRLVDGIELTSEPGVTDAEHDYAALWQRYFQRHAIPERHNPTLQQKHVPLRYRKHLTEFTAP
jgi:probable DNA metabolism protein